MGGRPANGRFHLRWCLLCALLVGCGATAIYLAQDVLRSEGSVDRGSERVALYRSIVLYDIEAFGLSDDVCINMIPSAEINEKDTRTILREVKYRSRSQLWKGSRLGVVKLDDGTTERIAISLYGGFFKVLGEKGHYQTEGRSRSALDRCIRRIVSEEFVPERRRQRKQCAEPEK